MPLDLIANVLLGGLLAGLVYGLMALGLSVIYGVVRIVNFAHGELMALAMYVAVIAFAGMGVDPLWMLAPVGAAFFGLGYVMQRGLINPFIDRPEHSQFMLLLAVALIVINGLLLGTCSRGIADWLAQRPALRMRGQRCGVRELASGTP